MLVDFCRTLCVGGLLSLIMCGWTSVAHYVWADFCRSLCMGGLLSLITCWRTSVARIICWRTSVASIICWRTRVVLVMWADLRRILACGLVLQRTSDTRTNSVKRTIHVNTQSFQIYDPKMIMLHQARTVRLIEAKFKKIMV